MPSTSVKDDGVMGQTFDHSIVSRDVQIQQPKRKNFAYFIIDNKVGQIKNNNEKMTQYFKFGLIMSESNTASDMTT